MPRRRLVRAGFVILGLLPGCGPGRPPDRAADLIADRSLTDVQAVQVLADGIRKIGGFDARSQLATVTADAQGRPSVTIRYESGISDSSEQIVVNSSGGAWTPEKQRANDIGSLNLALGMNDFGDLARVGEARNLQQIEIILSSKVATPEGDRKLDLLRAVISPAGIQGIAASARTSVSRLDIDVSQHWTVEFDRYDELVFTRPK